MILATAAIAAALMGGSGNTGTVWLPPGQAVTMRVTVSGTYEGVPRACIHNPGPIDVRTAYNRIRSDRGTQSRPAHVIWPGQTYCWTGRWVNVDGATWSVGLVNQATAAHNATTIRLTSGYLPVRATGMVSRVQAAAGGLAADGDWGPLTDARLAYIHSHARIMPGTVARVQAALGVTADGVWGNHTQDAFMLLRNASYGRY